MVVKKEFGISNYLKKVYEIFIILETIYKFFYFFGYFWNAIWIKSQDSIFPFMKIYSLNIYQHNYLNLYIYCLLISNNNYDSYYSDL